MITLTIVEQVKEKTKVNYKRSIKMFHSSDKAKKFIIPVVKEMQQAEKEKRIPKVKIDGVSYDTKSEKTLLLELRAIITTENEE